MTSQSKTQITYISPETLRQWILDGRSDFLVIGEASGHAGVHFASLAIHVDVRGSDFSGGNIRGAVNVSSRLFDSPNASESGHHTSWVIIRRQDYMPCSRYLIPLRRGPATFFAEQISAEILYPWWRGTTRLGSSSC